MMGWFVNVLKNLCKPAKCNTVLSPKDTNYIKVKVFGGCDAM